MKKCGEGKLTFIPSCYQFTMKSQQLVGVQYGCLEHFRQHGFQVLKNAKSLHI